MPVIDLGELGPGVPAGRNGPDTDPPGGYRGGSARHRRDARRAALAAVLVGSLTLLAAGDPLPRPLPELGVPARLGASVAVVGDWLFVTDPLGPGDVGQELTAYRLPSGPPGDAELAPAWRIRLPDGDVLASTVRDGTLLLTTRPYRSGAVTVRALDVTSGTPRWERSGRLEAVSVTGDLLLGTAGPEGPGAAAAGHDPLTTLVALDPASGAVRWSLSSPPGARRHHWSDSADRARTLLVVLPSGRVEIRDAATGALLRAGVLPAPGAGPDPRWSGGIVGDLFVTYEAGTVTAYGLPELDRRWSAPIGDRELGPVSCEPFLCSYRDDGGVRVWDPDTGRTRWTDRRWVNLYRVGGVLVASAAADHGRPGALAVLDPDSGRPVAELGVWELLTDGSGARFVGVRTDPHGRTRVAELDPAAGQVRLVTVVRGVSGDCGLAGRWLWCRRVDASVGLWALPARP